MAFPATHQIRCEHCGAAPLQDAVEVWEWDPEPNTVVYLGCIRCLRKRLFRGAWTSWRPWNLARHPILAIVGFLKNLSLGIALAKISPCRWLRIALEQEGISYEEFVAGQARPELTLAQRIEVADALSVLLLSVGYADGTLAAQEWNSIKNYLSVLYTPEPQVWQGLDLGVEVAPNPTQEEVDWAASVIRNQTRPEDHSLISHLLLGVAERVEGITQAERIALVWIGKACGFAQNLLDFALSENTELATGPWTVFGLVPGSTQAEIRKRYRELALDNHPDRHAHLGEAMVQAATQRMTEINLAYRDLRRRPARP